MKLSTFISVLHELPSGSALVISSSYGHFEVNDVRLYSLNGNKVQLSSTARWRSSLTVGEFLAMFSGMTAHGWGAADVIIENWNEEEIEDWEATTWERVK